MPRNKTYLMPSDATELTEDELCELTETVGGRVVSEDELNQPWVIEGIVHPGMTVIIGQPLTGKTTLARSMVKSVLEGHIWLERPVHFPASKRILFMCENVSGVREAKRLNHEHPGRVITVLTTLLTADPRAAEVLKRHNVGLVIVDSAWSAAGDLNDGARASETLAAMRAYGLPVLVIHHLPKSGSGSKVPAGSQAWTAEYEHFIKVDKTRSEATKTLTIWGNDVEGEIVIETSLNRQSLDVVEVPKSEEIGKGRSAPTPNQRGKRSKGPASIDHNNDGMKLGRRAAEVGIDPNLKPATITTLLLGGRSGQDPDRVQSINALLGREIGGKAIEKIIVKHGDAFASGYRAAAAAAVDDDTAA